MSEQRETFVDGELRNDNHQGGMLADGDANANEIQTEDGGMTGDNGDTGTLAGTEMAQQDKVIIWGTDSQCDAADLVEFEMLECQELEATLVEDAEDFVGLADHKPLQGRLSSCSKATVEQVPDNKSSEKRECVLHGASEWESSVSASRTELSSETDAFVTCLSTISSMDTAVDTAGRTQTTDSWNMASGPYSTISEDLTLVSQNDNTITERGKGTAQPSLSSGKSTIHRNDVDVNLNSMVHSEDVLSQAQVGNGVDLCEAVIDEHRKNTTQRNKAGNTILEGECYRRRSTEHKYVHAAKTSCEGNTKMNEGTHADEAPIVNYSPPQMGTKGTQSSIESKATKYQGSFDNSFKKQNSFDKSFKKQPSFENTSKKQLSFDNSPKRQGSFEKTVTYSSSSLERRKPWGSPSRPATPTSPKTTSCSPKKPLSASPAKVQSIRALSSEHSDSPQRGFSQTSRPPGKTSLSSCIPKPVQSQQREPEPRRTSPPQKPKNVRPKIITYVRKNPQAKPPGTDAPLEASALPLRLSSNYSQPAQKDTKIGPQPKSTTVLCSSNLLFDKYRQEMQKAEYYPSGMAATGANNPSSCIPQRLSGKSGSFHEEMSEKYPREVNKGLLNQYNVVCHCMLYIHTHRHTVYISLS